MLPSIFGEKLFDEFFDNAFSAMPAFPRHEAQMGKPFRNLMKTDVRELENSFELDIDLPGFKREDLKIELDNGYLTISAVRTENNDNEGKGKYIRRERYTGECSRSFYVGENLEPEDVSAKFADGILQLSFPKEPARKAPVSRRVNIA